jgi:hypothetical protein
MTELGDKKLPNLKTDKAQERAAEVNGDNQKLTVVNGWLSTDRAAAYIDADPKTLYRYRKVGRLRGFKLGKEWKYRVEDLDRLIKKSS